MKTTEINFQITLDENHVPEQIRWSATDGQESGISNSVLISIWDKKESNTLKIDLWTKQMTIEEMKNFFIKLFCR